MISCTSDPNLYIVHVRDINYTLQTVRSNILCHTGYLSGSVLSSDTQLGPQKTRTVKDFYIDSCAFCKPIGHQTVKPHSLPRKSLMSITKNEFHCKIHNEIHSC